MIAYFRAVLNHTFIHKQTFWTSFIQLSGAAIGAISTLFIYPQNLSLYGVYGFLTNTASLFVPVVGLGFGHVVLRYFPYFNQSDGSQSKFASAVAFIYSFGSLIFSIIFCVVYPLLYRHFTTTDSYIVDFLPYLLPITILYVFQDLGNQWCISLQKIIVPVALNNAMKILLPLLFTITVH